MKRFIHIKGAHNVRDIGGYATKDARFIKWKKLYRAGKLSGIPTENLDQLKTLNIKSICDFRTNSEQQKSPDKWYQLETLNRYSLPIGEGRINQPEWIVKAKRGDDMNNYLYQANKSYVSKNAHQFKAFFDILLDESNYPLIYHCTAGKDRTGFATVLLLSVLEVDHSIILRDYLLTNEYLTEHSQIDLDKAASYFGISKAQLQPVFMAKKAFLQGAFDAIKDDFGTMEQFLQEAIGIGPEEKKHLQSLLVTSKNLRS